MFAIYTSQCTLHHMPKCQHNLSVSRRHPETQFAEGQGRYRRNSTLFSRFLPEFCQLTGDNTSLCVSQYPEAVGCASPAASSPKSRSVFTFPFVPSHPAPQLQRGICSYPWLVMSKSLPFATTKHPFTQALKRKGSISYEKFSSLSPGNWWHVLPLPPHTCISCSSGRLNILLPRARFPEEI